MKIGHFEDNYYNLLEIHHQANIEEIKKAYWKKSKLMHPDSGGSVESQIRLNKAYEILSDPILKSHHDHFWNISGSGSTQRSKAKRGSQSATKTQKKTPGSNRNAAKTDIVDRVKAAIKKETEVIKQNSEKTFLQVKTALLSGFKQIKIKFYGALFSIPVLAILGFLVEYFWTGIFICLFLLYKYRKIYFDNCEIFIFDPDWQKKIAVVAGKRVKTACEQKMEKVSQKYTTILSYLAIAKQPSGYADNEYYVAQRILISLFLSGYIPATCDISRRLLIVLSGEEKIVVRYRHRDGSPTNITYVKDLYRIMTEEKVNRGFLFASPGLSGQAAVFADSHHIAHYSLEEMNEWLNATLHRNAQGPSGDILIHIENLYAILQQLAPRLTG